MDFCPILISIWLDLKTNLHRLDKTNHVHASCTGSKGDKSAHEAAAVPVRFLLAGRNGHIDDFPWHWFVHGARSNCRGILVFYEAGASLQTDNLWVECKECGAKKQWHVHLVNPERKIHRPVEATTPIWVHAILIAMNKPGLYFLEQQTAGFRSRCLHCLHWWFPLKKLALTV